MSVYLILSRVTRAAGAVPVSSWAAVACPTRVVTNEDETRRVVLLGAWVRGGGVGNGTEAGTDDRHPSIASLRITSNPDHGALYWRARPVLVGDAVPAAMGWERCSGILRSSATPATWPAEDARFAKLEWPCDVVLDPGADASTTHPSTVVEPVCAEILYAPADDYHNWPRGLDALGAPTHVPGSNPTRDESPDAFKFAFDLLAASPTGDASTMDGADAMKSSTESTAAALVVAVPDPPSLRYTHAFLGSPSERPVSFSATLMSRTRVSGIELRDVDDGSFAVTVRIQSSIGNYLSVTGAGAETLERARNPFERGDGVMDAGVLEFTAMPADAARMLAALEYTHAVDDKYDGDGSAVDEISVSVMSGACVRKDVLGLTGCPRAADVSSESTVRIWIRVSGRVKDLGTRSTPAWERGFSSLLPLIVSAMALAAWAVAVIVSACAWVLENAGITCNGTCGDDSDGDDASTEKEKDGVENGRVERRVRSHRRGFDGV